MLRRSALALLGLVLLWASLGLHGVSSADLVRLRNALYLEGLPIEAFRWTPETAPPDFLRETRSPPRPLVSIAQRVRGTATDPLEISRRIAEHLLTSAPLLQGGAVRDDLQTTYRVITTEGRGYCADFVRLFEGLATAVGLQTRVWSFSFNGFGGGGHRVIEVWKDGHWLLLDIFNNVVFLDAKGEPMDALQLVQALQQPSSPLSTRPLVSSARPGFEHAAKLEAYYRRGRLEWALAWGSNPFTRDAFFERLDGWRPLVQLLLWSRHELPPLRAIQLAGNESALSSMVYIRLHLLIVGLLTPVLLLTVLLLPLRRRVSA